MKWLVPIAIRSDNFWIKNNERLLDGIHLDV